MSYTSIYKEEAAATVPALTKISASKTLGDVAIRSAYRQDRPETPVQTYVLLTPEVAKAAGFRAGTRVSVLKGTGRDAGKVRIVANSKGTLKLGKTGSDTYNLRIRTSSLLTRRMTTKDAAVTSYAKGAITIAL